MDSSYQSGCNCAGGPNKCDCDKGYICCSQKGNEKYFGLCIKEENGCNITNGFAKEKGVSKSKKFTDVIEMGNSEGFQRGISRMESRKNCNSSSCDSSSRDSSSRDSSSCIRNGCKRSQRRKIKRCIIICFLIFLLMMLICWCINGRSGNE